MMKTSLVAAIAIMGAVSIAPPAAWAEPDPHIPNGAADWCPGGERPRYGGGKYCLGIPFADNTFYSQTWSFGPSGPFAPGAWFGFAACSRWIEGSIQGALPSGCGGVRSVDIR
jgi:hypothetical protein